jgi:hypothetical protein
MDDQVACRVLMWGVMNTITRLSALVSAPIVLLAFVGGCTTGSDTAQSTSALSMGDPHTVSASAKTVTRADFDRAIHDAEQWMGGPSGCTFSATKHGNTVELTMTADGTTASLAVSATSTIKLTDRSEGDGTDETYTIEGGGGSVRIIHASDAFESFALTSGSKTATCEVDF